MAVTRVIREPEEAIGRIRVEDYSPAKTVDLSDPRAVAQLRERARRAARRKLQESGASYWRRLFI